MTWRGVSGAAGLEVIKTDDLESGQKVFINATSSEWVEKPHEKSIPDSPEEMGIRVRARVFGTRGLQLTSRIHPHALGSPRKW